MTNTSWTIPDQVETYVKSATQVRFGAGGLKLRSTRSAGRGAAVSGAVVRTRRPRLAPTRPSSLISRSTVQRATGMPSRLSASQVLRAP
jgi:hypothetical protein